MLLPKQLNIWKVLLSIYLGLIACSLLWQQQSFHPGHSLHVSLVIEEAPVDDFELFYDTSGNGFSPDAVQRVSTLGSRSTETLRFYIPVVSSLKRLRLDLGHKIGNLDVRGISFSGSVPETLLTPTVFHNSIEESNDIGSIDVLGETVRFEITGDDPYIVLKEDLLRDLEQRNLRLTTWLKPFILSLTFGFIVTLLSLLLLNQLIAPDKGKRWDDNIFEGSTLSVALRFTIATAVTISSLHFFSSELDERMGTAVSIGFREHEEGEFQLFFSNEPENFNAVCRLREEARTTLGHEVRFFLPNTDPLHYLRLDLNKDTGSIAMKYMELAVGTATYVFEGHDLLNLFHEANDIEPLQLDVDNNLIVSVTGMDPYLTIPIDMGPFFMDLRSRSNRGFWMSMVGAFLFCFVWLLLIRLQETLSATSYSSDLLFAAIFCTMLTLPTVWSILQFGPLVETKENRTMNMLPEFRIDKLDEFTEDYAKYYKDHFGLRQVLFRLNSLFHVHLLNSSPLPDNVTVGKDQWLFLNSTDAILQQQGICRWTDESFDNLLSVLERNHDWLAKYGISYYVYIPPYKSSIYPEYLPDRIKRVGSGECLTKFKEYVAEHSHINLVTADSALLAAKSVAQLYYPPDIHWNHVGGYFGTKTLIEAIRRDHPDVAPVPDFNEITVQKAWDHMGDLAGMIGLGYHFPRNRYTLEFSEERPPVEDAEELVPDNMISALQISYLASADSANKKTLLMFHDSFAVAMMPYIGHHFKRTALIWSPSMDPSLVSEEKPDIVVHEIMSHFMMSVLDPNRQAVNMYNLQLAN